MRRVLIFSILLCVAVMAFGETSVKARRGDTWISIATKYDVDPVELKAVNGNIAECYVGMNVVIPDYMLEKAKLQREAKLNEEKQKALIHLYEKADDFEKLGKLKDAKKVYDEILEQDHSAQAYYGRGWVQYNRKKWKDAISDLNYAATLSDASAELKESANELSRDASERKAEADAKRSELIGNIIGATVATAGIVAGTVMMSKAVKNSGQTRSTPSHPSTIRRSTQSYSNQNIGPLAQQMSQPGYFQQEGQRMLQQSIAAVEQQEMSEYQQVRQNYLAMGKDISLMEFRALKGKAIMDLKEQGIDVIAEQNAANKEMRDLYRSQMNSGKDNVAKIKQQNDLKYGTSSSTTSTAGKSTTTNTSSKTSSQNTSTATTMTSVEKDVGKDKESSYYGEFTQRHVNLYVSSSSNNHTVGFYNCEVYRKGSQYYVKIQDQFYKVLPCSKANYNRMIRYGAKEYYFNF